MNNILFVDDEPPITQALSISLEAMGFTCHIEQNMSAALHALEQKDFSVVVTDIMMPPGPDFEEVSSSETGYYLINLIRKKYPDLPIICLSVIGDQEKIISLKKQGVLYLRKGETPLETAVKLIQSKATGVYHG